MGHLKACQEEGKKMRIGKYRILFGMRVWFQTYKPTVVKRHFGFIWILKEIDVSSVDPERTAELGTVAYCEGRRYVYRKKVKR